jgi:ribosomal protein L11 methyltransferase
VNNTIEINLPEAVSEESLAAFVQILPFETLSLSAKRQTDAFSGPWQLLWVVEGTPIPQIILDGLNSALALMNIQTIRANELTITPLDDINWLEASYQPFKPFSAGAFFIHGDDYKDDVPAADLMPLKIDASIAFGSGEHGTTHGCLLLLQKLHTSGFAPKNILDMGCGSGILAVAAVKLWTVPTLGVDIEDDAKALTLEHAKLNHAADHITAAVGDGYKAAEVQTEITQNKPFDLVIANILAVPLKAMAPDMLPCLAPNGYLVLSGMLHDQADSVIAIHDALGLELLERLEIGDWTSLLYKKSA